MQVVARYGYQDSVDHRNTFISQIVSTIMHKLELKAGLKYMVGGIFTPHFLRILS